ncbi:uncharacterized protein LOC105845207 isoform X2 [Hydra vulgaris]|uniref:Uncharacterized protein LOC105845207 isoform X2 n=1 Tax=Hydra vulgaris TaxID=6087 RepID=A0ABM4BHK0_HYDVU
MDILRTQGQKSKNISHQPIPKGSTLSIISENLHSSSLDHQSAESKKPPICVKNYMGLAIFSLVCFFPIGTLALYNSRQPFKEKGSPLKINIGKNIISFKKRQPNILLMV